MAFSERNDRNVGRTGFKNWKKKGKEKARGSSTYDISRRSFCPIAFILFNLFLVQNLMNLIFESSSSTENLVL
jgi:hypothetical protein